MQDVMKMNFTRSMASPFHWLLSCLCISNILLIVSNMLESLGALEVIEKMFFDFTFDVYPARALRALGLLLADGAPTVGVGKTF